jgi:hypothetical protein
MESEAVFEMLTHEMHQMVRKLQQIVRSGRKSPEGEGGILQVFENRTFSGGNTFCGVAEEAAYAYFDLGYPDFLRYDDRDVVEQRVARLLQLQPHFTPLSGSERNTFEFFAGLERHLRRLTG